MTVDEALRVLLSGGYLPGEVLEGWYCGPPIRKSHAYTTFPDDGSAIDWVKKKADEGSPIHQAAVRAHLLFKLDAWAHYEL